MESSELPRGNELSRDHVNKPYVSGEKVAQAISAVQGPFLKLFKRA